MALTVSEQVRYFSFAYIKQFALVVCGSLSILITVTYCNVRSFKVPELEKSE